MPENLLDDKTLERIMDTITLGTPKPHNITVCSVDEWSIDEHDSSRTVVVRLDESGKFIQFSFRFNFYMRDSEVIDYMGIKEVFAVPEFVTKVNYVAANDIMPPVEPTVAGIYLSRGTDVVILDTEGDWRALSNHFDDIVPFLDLDVKDLYPLVLMHAKTEG